MARVLIVGGGCRGRGLAAMLGGEGHAVRVTTRTQAGRPPIEATGAECWVGTPDRLATLRGALDGVAVLCWMLGTASGERDALRDLHGSRLEFFLRQAVDTTVRGVVYEAAGSVDAQILRAGARIVRELAAVHAIPNELVTVAPQEREAWQAAAMAAIAALLGRA